MPLWKLQGGGGSCYFDMYGGEFKLHVVIFV